eukprot:1158979-Pelagomonas_calceolata.AAC.5
MSEHGGIHRSSSVSHLLLAATSSSASAASSERPKCQMSKEKREKQQKAQHDASIKQQREERERLAKSAHAQARACALEGGNVRSQRKRRIVRRARRGMPALMRTTVREGGWQQ